MNDGDVDDDISCRVRGELEVQREGEKEKGEREGEEEEEKGGGAKEKGGELHRERDGGRSVSLLPPNGDEGREGETGGKKRGEEADDEKARETKKAMMHTICLPGNLHVFEDGEGRRASHCRQYSSKVEDDSNLRHSTTTLPHTRRPSPPPPH